MAAPADNEQRLMNELGRIVLDRIASNRLKLPVMPAVAQKCLGMIDDPKYQQKKLTGELERDPLLAASVLRSSMTAANSTGGGVKTLDQAVACLGMGKLKELFVEFMTRELFKSADKRIAAATAKVWEHSIAVGLLSRDIAALASGANSDTCYLAGLLHDVGKPIMAAMLLEAEKQLKKTNWVDLALWTSTVEQGHRKVGVALATEWKLAEEVTTGIRDCTEYDTANHNGVANIIRFANALAEREGFATSVVDAGECATAIEQGVAILGLKPTDIDGMVQGLQERVAQAA